MDRSEAINELAMALAKAQAAIEPALKYSTNPHFGSRFADLASIWEVARGPITSQGLSVVQAPEPVEGGMDLRTILMHSSGQFLSSVMPLSYNPNNMQSLGSALTYARRYALAAMLGIVTEDDDGNQAVAKDEPPNREYSPAPCKNGHSATPSRNGLPSQAKPAYASQPSRNQAPIEHDDPDRLPKTGKELYKWAKVQPTKAEYSATAYLAKWGKMSGFPTRIIDWSNDQVISGLTQVLDYFDSLESRVDLEEVY